MEPLQPPPQAQHKLDSDGQVFIWEAGPGLIAERGVGLLTLPLARFFIEFLAPLVVPGTRWDFFADLEQVTGYTREAREQLSAFSLDRLSSLGAVHFLISSKFVALGLSSYRDDIGDGRVHVYSERASFLRSFADAVQARR